MIHPMREMKRYIVTGFLIVAPISITIFLCLWFVGWVDSLLAPVVYTVLGRNVPGLGVAVGLGILLVVGYLSSNIIGKQMLEVTEDILLRIPVFNWLYRTVKQLTETFTPSGSMHFKSLVLVEYPRPGVHQIGFVTQVTDIVEAGSVKKTYCVYIPTNHLYIGDIVLVPADKVSETDIPLQDGVQAFLSAGASLPLKILKKDRGPSA